MLYNAFLIKGLTPREIDVANLIAKGLSNKAIAQYLFISDRTIKFHVTNIFRKLKIKSRAEMIVWCIPHISITAESSKPIVITDVETNKLFSKPSVELPKGNQ